MHANKKETIGNSRFINKYRKGAQNEMEWEKAGRVAIMLTWWKVWEKRKGGVQKQRDY